MCGGCKAQVSFLQCIQNSNAHVLSHIHTDNDTSLAHRHNTKKTLFISITQYHPFIPPLSPASKELAVRNEVVVKSQEGFN